jgi:hypothetical protein
VHDERSVTWHVPEHACDDPTVRSGSHHLVLEARRIDRIGERRRNHWLVGVLRASTSADDRASA